MSQTENTIKSGRILADGVVVSNDSSTTRLNNNDLVLGPSGSGKTRGYVMPNILQAEGSFIVTDTKGNLARTLGPTLAERGYAVHYLDLARFSLNSHIADGVTGIGYNPFDFIDRDPKTGRVSERDVMSMAHQLSPIENPDDIFWDRAAETLIAVLIGYVLDYLPACERNLSSLGVLAENLDSGVTADLLDELVATDPEGFAARKWRMVRSEQKADKMYASICGIVAEKLNVLTFSDADALYSAKHRLSFEELATKRTAVFITVSDTDRSMDRVVNLLYAQALQELCAIADANWPTSKLPVPVRLYLDDFATNCTIADFDKIISVIRSRDLSVSVILQDYTQLVSSYGEFRAATIANNCDHWLYLGGQDVATARKIAEKVSRTTDSILSMPLDRGFLLQRGAKALEVTPFDVSRHPLYRDPVQALDVPDQLSPAC
ncbi:MAG: VirD4-like conjugal transfer protein, CD1115 family [Tractidigestivibacter sp.]|jgi:type IV secretion system protein VirD4|uniref:VirD4-like conjugal transfer protein, CD1115 family n=1 Tax=Tractidigestivibacter sp. TaxID=2847320 RepID=UPI003D935F88